jgi:hypothetical protein
VSANGNPIRHFCVSFVTDESGPPGVPEGTR